MGLIEMFVHSVGDLEGGKEFGRGKRCFIGWHGLVGKQQENNHEASGARIRELSQPQCSGAFVSLLL